MFMKLTDSTHGTVYCPIKLNPRDNTHYCPVHSVVLTVPDEAPFSTSLTQHIHHTDGSHTCMFPTHTPQRIEEMALCWTEVSLLLKLALKVRGCKVDADE